MPKITEAQGASHEGVIPEHDADLREDGTGVEVQEPILAEPQERTGEHGEFHAGRNAGEQPDPAERYADWSRADLAGECERRKLSKSGTVPELTARLVENDQADKNED